MQIAYRVGAVAAVVAVLVLVFLFSGDNPRGDSKVAGSTKIVAETAASPADLASEEREELHGEGAPVAPKEALQIQVFVRARIDGKTSPLPDAMVELLAVVVAEDGEEELGPVLVSAQADSVGMALISIPTDRPVALQATAPAMLTGTVRVRDETIDRLRTSDSPRMNLDLFPGQCIVRVTGEVVNFPSDDAGELGLYIRVSVDSPPEQIRARVGESIKSAKLDETGRFEIELSAPAGQQLYCSVYASDGSQLAVQGSGRQIAVDGVWECHFDLDANDFLSEYIFKVVSEVAEEVAAAGEMRFQAKLLDAATGSLIGGHYFRDHQTNDDVHSLWISTRRESILRIDHYLLGTGERRLTPAVIAQSQVSPDIVKLEPLVHVLIRESDFPDVDLSKLRAALTFPSGAVVSARLEQDGTDPSLWAIAYPIASDLLGFRLGDRLFQTTLSPGGQYFLSDGAVREISVDTTSATLVIDEWQYQGRVNTIRVTHKGLAWGLFTVKSSGANSVKLTVDLPIGLVNVDLWDGVKAGLRTREYEVGVGSAPLMLPVY